MIKISQQPKKPIIFREASKRMKEVIAEPAMIEKLSGYGLQEKEIADVYGVTVKQFYRAKRRYKDVKEALFRGKNRAAKSIVESLYKKAFGFTKEEIIYTKHKGITTAHPVIKYYPPDMKAIIFWLKNRKPNEWKEKVVSSGQLDEETLTRLREIAVKEIDENLL